VGRLRHAPAYGSTKTFAYPGTRRAE
jgi:hypothetical protein